MKKIFSFLFALFALFACFSDNSKFNSLRIYQIMVSSFQNGDNSIGYTKSWGTSEENSGDLQGIINSLDYIKSLDVNAIWLTPIFDSKGANTSQDADSNERLDSTGYYTKDYFKIDPNFGSEETFVKLVEECHKRDIYVILDGVFGHWGDEIAPSPTNKLPKRQFGKFSGASYPESLEFFKEVATYWIKKYKIDGWRLDQCYQVGARGEGIKDRHNYWYDLRLAVEEACKENAKNGEKWGTLGYLVGECWKNTAKEIQDLSVEKGTAPDYGLYSCFDFPARNYLVKSLSSTEKSAGNLVDYVLKDSEKKGYKCSDGYIPNLFLTNHDVERLGTLLAIQDKEQNPNGKKSNIYYKKHKLAMSILAAYSGPITFYYGDEWGAFLEPEKIGKYPCYKDNSARTPGKISGFSIFERSTINYASKLMQIRKEHEALWNGTNETLAREEKYYVGKKVGKNEEIIYILNFGDSDVSYEVKKGTNLITGKPVKKSVTVEPYSASFIICN